MIVILFRMSDLALPSPSFCIDLERLEANCARTLSLGLPLRPHVKTSKCVEIARLQQGGVHPGIVCSTLQECEHFGAAGFRDILYGVPFEGSKLERALALHKSLPAFHLMLDSLEALRCLEAFLAGEQAEVFSVWVAIDAGYGREGVPHDSPLALALATAVHASKFTTLAGLYSHSGDSYNCAQGGAGAAAVAATELTRMTALSAALGERGVPVPTLSLGATPSAMCGKWGGTAGGGTSGRGPALELHPGNYVFFDRQQAASGSCGLEDVACYVVARVVGAYRDRNTLLIDAGACALHKDAGGLQTWGCLREDPNMVLQKLTQEVAVVGTADGSPINFDAFPLGTVCRVLPNHSCMTAAMFPNYNVTRDVGGERRVVAQWAPCKYW